MIITGMNIVVSFDLSSNLNIQLLPYNIPT